MATPLAKACCGGNLDDVSIAIANGSNDWNAGLYQACVGGHHKIAKLMISKGATDMDFCMEAACAIGNMEIVDLLISRGCQNFDGGLDKACEYGRIAMAKRMIGCGAAGWSSTVLRKACESGKIAIVKLLISDGANDWSTGLEGACRGGHREIADLMIYNGGGAYDVGDAMELACEGGHLSVVELLLTKAANDRSRLSTAALNRGLANAAAGGYLTTVRRLAVVIGANGEWNNAFQAACRNGHKPVAEFMESKNGINRNDGLASACQGGHRSIIDWLTANGANDLNSALCAASRGGQPDIVKWLIDNGAKNLNAALYYASFSSSSGQLEVVVVLLNAGASKADEYFDANGDAGFFMALLKTTNARRSTLSGVNGIQRVFDRADAYAANLRALLTDIDLPAVLQTVVVEYCISLR